MILTGLLAGSRESAAGRGFWFIVSTVAHVPPVYLILTQHFAAAPTPRGTRGGCSAPWEHTCSSVWKWSRAKVNVASGAAFRNDGYTTRSTPAATAAVGCSYTRSNASPADTKIGRAHV